MTAVALSVDSAAVAAGIAVGVTLVTFALIALVRHLARRRRLSPEDRIAEIAYDLNLRIEEMGRQVQEALEHVRAESRRTRFFGEIAGSIDLDEVLRRTLDAAAGLPGADGALVSVVGPNGAPITSSVGLSEAEAEEYAVGRAPTGRRVRSMTVSFEPYEERAPGEAPPIRAGLAVPLRSEAETIGILSVFSRGEPEVFSEDQLRQLEDLAERAGPPIENALRFREARQLADLDALTGLHNRRYFHETLAREVARAHRYGRRLGLVVFDLDDFKAINDRLGHLAGDAVLAEVAERVRDVVRQADVPCRVGGDEFAVILAESSLEDAEQLCRRLQTQIAARPVAQAGRLSISAGIAEVRPEDDAVSFFQRADDALYRAKEQGKGRVEAADGDGGPPEKE